MNEARDAPPWEGGSGGLLEVVDMMCTVTETMAQIIRKQAEMIERTKWKKLSGKNCAQRGKTRTGSWTE